MSLFFSNREVREVGGLLEPKKRKKDQDVDIDITELYSCEWCTEEYDSETELHVHVRGKHSKHVKKLLTEDSVCKTCLTEHENQEELLKHIKSLHLLSDKDSEFLNREIFICDICNQVYFNKEMLSIHMQYIHQTEKKKKATGTCPKCLKNIQIKHVWFHFQRHQMQSIGCCPICLKKCKNLKELMEHVKVHPTDFRCTLCSYSSKVKENFSNHMEAHCSNLHLSPNITIGENVLGRCFVPRKATPIVKLRDLKLGMRGYQLMDLCICVLCRAVCKPDEKSAHVAKYHLVDIVATKKQYMCTCGEQFFNNVLLKHHVFKMKGDHKPSES